VRSSAARAALDLTGDAKGTANTSPFLD